MEVVLVVKGAGALSGGGESTSLRKRISLSSRTTYTVVARMAAISLEPRKAGLESKVHSDTEVKCTRKLCQKLYSSKPSLY